jgi:hypothetical protein
MNRAYTRDNLKLNIFLNSKICPGILNERTATSGIVTDRMYFNNMYKMIRPTVDTTKMYFYYATCFGHIRTIIRQFHYMNTTVIAGY